MTTMPRDQWRYYNGLPTWADRLTSWLHAQGELRFRRGLGSRLLGGASWVLWMNLFVARHRMSAGNRMRAVARLWLWQAWRRIVRRPIVVEIPGGPRVLCPPWSRLAGALATIGLHEPEETLFVLDLLRPEDSMIDVGANLGVYTLVAAARGARVTAFEPGDSSRDVLAGNVTSNGFEDSVSIHPLAVADFTGQARFTAGLDVGDHLIADGPDEEEGRSIDVTTIDDFLERRGLWPSGRGALLLKVDAEGADARVLSGAGRLVEEVKPVVIVEIWEGGSEIRAWLETRGYGIYRYRPAETQLEEIPEDFSGQANFIAVPVQRLAWVQDRLASSTRPPLRHPRVHWCPDRGAAIPAERRPA